MTDAREAVRRKLRVEWLGVRKRAVASGIPVSEVLGGPTVEPVAGKCVTGVILSDLHALDKLSPVPPGFEQSDGTPVAPNSVGRALSDCFARLAREWAEPDVIVVNGDATAGQNPKSKGVGVYSTEPEDQVEAAAQLVEMFRPRKTVVVLGTPYHVEISGHEIEEDLARRLKSVQIGPGRQVAGLKFILEKWGFRAHFAHHVPTSQSEWFLPTPISKEGIRVKLAWRRIGDIDMVARGHNHVSLQVRFSKQVLVACPCWQLATGFMHKRSGEPLVDIGAVRFRIYPKPDEFGERFRVINKTFDIKEARTRVVRI